MAKSAANDIDEDLIHKLAELLDETGLTEIELGRGDWRVRVSKAAAGQVVHAAPAAAAPAAPAGEPAAAAEAAIGPDHPGAVTSPMVGVCYLAPDPNSQPFIAVGTEVKEGDTLLLIEAMKVFNPITAPKAGKVAQILVSDGTPVEYGEVLVVLE